VCGLAVAARTRFNNSKRKTQNSRTPKLKNPKTQSAKLKAQNPGRPIDASRDAKEHPLDQDDGDDESDGHPHEEA